MYDLSVLAHAYAAAACGHVEGTGQVDALRPAEEKQNPAYACCKAFEVRSRQVRIPLRYQMTEFDCGPTALTNALSFLFDTQEMPPDFLKMIYQCTLDECNVKGVPFRYGTSPMAIEFLGQWFNRYAARVGFPLRCEYYEKEEVTFSEGSPVIKGLREGASAVVKCLLGCEHYVTLTGIDDQYIHVFDPYFSNLRKKSLKESFCLRHIEVVKDRPLEMNRRVPIKAMDCHECFPYALQHEEKRVALLFFKTKQWANVPLK